VEGGGEGKTWNLKVVYRKSVEEFRERLGMDVDVTRGESSHGLVYKL
jgi:hypothetical protein